ncbi:DUF1173 family protein [Paracoccus zhejiangensis]|uniref:DUF1173 domain-containing protein n=1 Tax=Paracoccus zhejiangensis TaxID=1077935 RepID=A0A2H5F5J3_9RHOB|nr:DUF1173 family protein [Paracoccus zhejiangensis]AUH66828.1 hypothetical protein CX676_21260 [Paracoccus zhejiangensis]
MRSADIAVPASRYQLGADTFDAGSPDWQSILGAAHQNKSRPACLCSAASPLMYVAKIQGKYYLKRMPGTGHAHDPSCDSFAMPPELSGFGQVEGKASATDDSGETTLKLDFPLSVRGRRDVAPDAGDHEPTVAEASPSKLGLLGVLHFLWDAAGLTMWRPAYARRSWWIVHRELTAAAERTSAKSMPLSSVLFVPPMFSVEKKEELAAARRRFLHHLQAVKGKPMPIGVLVAELKDMEPSQYGRRIRFKHLPDMVFFMDEELCARFDKIAGDKIRDVEAVEGAHSIVIATFNMRENYAEIRLIAVMPVTAQWIPFDHDRELRLIEGMRDRHFSKSLRYNMRQDAPIANALLLDTSPPTALYCPSQAIEPELERDLVEIAGEGVYPAWIWSAQDDDMPALPAGG